jgi:hypothetical protein
VAAHVGDREPGGRDRALVALFGAVLAFVVVAPLTRRGWLLLLDWVPGPRRVVGAGATGPVFSLPLQALHFFFGAAVGWMPLAIALGLACAGAAMLVGGPWPARVAAGVAYAWNPFVFDRIAVGQISVLAGYALMPWLARAALRKGAVTTGLWWAAAALCSVHFAWIGGVIVLAIAVVRRRERRVAAGFAIALAIAGAALAVLFVGAHGTVPARGTPQVLDSFATKSDVSLGRSAGLLAEQGFWRPVVTRPRDDLGAAFPVIAGASIAAAGVGLVLARRRTAWVALAALAGWILAHGSAGPFGFAYRFLFVHLPGFGVMREAQKWDALVCLAIAVGTGCLAARITPKLAWCVVLLPIALAPTLAWGLSDRIAPSHYPASWAPIRAAVDQLGGDVAVVPFEQYPEPVITGDRTVADVGPSYFGTHAIVSRDPRVPGLPGDNGRRARIAAALLGDPSQLADRLRHLDVRGVLVLGPDALPLGRDPGFRAGPSGDGAALWVISQKSGPATD